MTALKMINLALAFGLELAALAALAYWGFTTGPGVLAWVLGLGAPLVMVVVWGLWMAPTAARRLPDPGRMVAQLGIFGIAALALAVAGQPGWAAIFAVLTVINTLLLYVWKQ